MKKIVLLAINVFQGQTQQINTEKSIVTFKVDKTEGTIGGMTGEVILNLDDLAHSKFIVSIDPNTINTGKKKRDKHLKSDNFFNVEIFPKITFTSSKILKIGNSYVAMGTVNLHGVTQTVNIDFTIDKTEKGMILKGSITLNQKDYNMSKKDENVDIEIVWVLIN